jgi:hypothetical protein
VEVLFKTLIWDNLIRAATKKLFAALPFLAWGPLGWLTNYIIAKYAEILYVALSDTTKMHLIQIRNKELEKQFHIASIDLRLTAMNHGEDSEEYQRVRELTKDRLARFISFNH